MPITPAAKVGIGQRRKTVEPTALRACGLEQNTDKGEPPSPLRIDSLPFSALTKEDTMEFSLTDEQQLMLENLREFCDRWVTEEKIQKW